MKATDVKDVRLQRHTRGRGWWLLLAGVAGAVTAFFADPDRGNARRKEALDHAGGLVRRARRRVEQLTRGLSAQTTGWSRKLTHLRPAQPDGDDLSKAEVRDLTSPASRRR